MKNNLDNNLTVKNSFFKYCKKENKKTHYILFKKVTQYEKAMERVAQFSSNNH